MKNTSLILFVLFCAGCAKENQWDCFTSFGDDTTELRTLTPFTGVYTDDKIDIVYRYSLSYSAEVSFGDKVIKHVETKVDGGSLQITNNAKCNWVRNLSKKPKVVIYAPSFDLLENHGVGNITFEDTLRTEHFTYDQWNSNGSVDLLIDASYARFIVNTGVSAVNVVGSADEIRIYSAGSGKFDSRRLIGGVTLVNNSSNQDIKVFTGSYLFGKITKSGDIKYLGSPSTIDSDITGTGVIVPL
jgi:hypothetical protein